MIFSKYWIHIYSLFFILIGLWFTLTIAAKETPNKDLEKLLFLDQEILPVDQAFKLEASLIGKEIFLEWDIEKNCYLYLDKFSFKITNSDRYLYPSFPRGELLEDEYFGLVEVFFNNLQTSFKIDTLLAKEIVVTYQGCNQEGYCYTPIKKYILIKNNHSLQIH